MQQVQSLSTSISLESLSNILQKTMKAMFTVTVSKIWLFQGRSVLWPAQQFTGSERVTVLYDFKTLSKLRESTKYAIALNQQIRNSVQIPV